MIERVSWARPPTVGPSVLLWLSIFVLAGCGESGSRDAGSRPPAANPSSLELDVREFSDIGDFVVDYWRRPIPLQGAPPEHFNPLEASFQPETCGTCHPQQYADWQTTIHSSAYSPGLSGQLVSRERNNYPFVQSCLVCHAPLSEQAAMVPDTLGRLVGNPFFDRSLQKQGMICAACHFRGWKKYGPPRRDGSLDPSPEGSPHGGVTRTPFFEDSRFCSGCHQFAAPAANGKSLQNTYREWQNSRYAAEGTHCQNCHMPERRHLWRGIHDSTMVADAVSAEWESATGGGGGGGGGVSLHVTNTGVGHRFPTYVTPEIRVKIEFLAGDGQPIAGSGNMAVISRKVSASTGQWVEAADTRLSPDSSMAVAARPPPGARYARGTILVIPDRFYEDVFAGLLTGSLTDSSRVLIAAAHRRASMSSYLIFDDTVRVGR